MDMVLANNEQQVASWNYADISGLLQKGTCDIAVTNKRLISTQQTKKMLRRTDIDLKDVTSIKITCKNTTSNLLIFLVMVLVIIMPVCLIFGLLFLASLKYNIKYHITILSAGSEKEFINITGTGGKRPRKLRLAVDQIKCKEIVKNITMVIGNTINVEYINCKL